MKSTYQPKYPCKCCFIPEIVVKELKKEGYDIEMPNVNMDKSIRMRRQSLMLMDRALLAPGTSARHIFDSKNTGSTRFKLVREEGGAAIADVDANAAYDNGGLVREYFKTVLNWNSIDNNSLDLVFNIHYMSKYNNAFWDGEQMTFGDGDGVNFQNFVRALDVTGHELTHGIVQYTANLEYKGQSGALNEHFADVFGSAVKQWAAKETEKTANWLMGEICMMGKFKGKAIRSMKAPADAAVVLSAQPDHMKKIFKGTADNGGVHINSGIPNYAFYLVSMDITTEKAAKLWFAALQLLKPTSKFTDLYKALTKAAKKLVADKTLPSTTQTSVDKAFRKVGIKK
ncbi:MAG: M4 family metallopeptidase [Saprospiraceae bacterium]|nr:M4 family metallopeptidase [Saprospiraceae bacterium]